MATSKKAAPKKAATKKSAPKKKVANKTKLDTEGVNQDEQSENTDLSEMKKVADVVQNKTVV